MTDRTALSRTRRRLLAWSGGTTLIALIVLGGLIYLTVAGALRSAAVTQLEERAANLEQLARFGPQPFVSRVSVPAGAPDELGLVVGGPTSGTIGILARPDGQPFGAGSVMVGSATGLPYQPGIASARVGADLVQDAELRGIPGRILSRQLQVGDQSFVVQVFADRVAENRTLATLAAVLVGGGALAVIVALLVGWLYAGRALVPIRRSMERQREFAADASHELRTPLAVVRVGLASLRQRDTTDADRAETIADLDGTVDDLSRLVDDLLVLARADSGAAELERGPADLADAASDALGGLSSVAAERGLCLNLDAEPAPLEGDVRRLRQLVAILADNAIRHSPAGTDIDVRVRRHGGQAELIVEDHGAGIRPEDLPHVFDRFWRATDAPPGGTGLGLAIASWIVDRHGGWVRAENRQGGGARFVVRIPAGSPASA